MSKRIYILKFIIILLFNLNLFSKDNAEITLTASVSKNIIPVGEKVMLELLISSKKTISPFFFKIPDSIQAKRLVISKINSRQVNIKIINGVKMTTIKYFYFVYGKSEGDFVIPSIQISTKNNTIKSDPIKIKVVSNQKSNSNSNLQEPYFSELKIKNKKYFINEIIPCEIIFYSKGKNSLINLHKPIKLENNNFAISPFRHISKRENVYFHGELYSKVTFPSEMFSLKPGNYKLGPAKVDGIIHSIYTNNPSSFFPFISGQKFVKSTKTNILNINIKPFPENAPNTFNGAVGENLSIITATLDKKEFNIGDPITLNVVIAGKGNHNSVEDPLFLGNNNDNWKTYSMSKGETKVFDNFFYNKSFSKTIIPKKVVSKIPSFKLTYLDPKKEKYVTIESKEIPLKINPAKINIDSIKTNINSNKKPEPEKLYNNILHIRTNIPKMISYSNKKNSFIIFNRIIIYILIIAILLILIIYVKNKNSLKKIDHIITCESLLRLIQKKSIPNNYLYKNVLMAIEDWLKNNKNVNNDLTNIANNELNKCRNILYSNKKNSNAIDEDEILRIKSILKKLS